MGISLSEFLNAINYTKVDIIDGDDVAEKEYTPFIINRCLSYFMDTVLHVNEMNMYSDIPKKIQFLYLKTAIRKNKRFSKWMKTEKIEHLELIKEYYGYGNKKAKEALEILSPEQIKIIQEKMFRGGVRK